MCHPECREKVPLPCVPTGSAQRTPSKSALGRGGQLADYVPRTSPMVPAIIVHCVNELDTRGLHEVGLYRIPGSEKEVRIRYTIIESLHNILGMNVPKTSPLLV